MAKDKERLDVLLVERGLAETRARARAAIMAGEVRVNGERVDKAGTPVPIDAAIEVAAPMPYVSRGGFKLAGALDAFGVAAAGRVCADVGACTGGFTDVLLQRGAARVYAIDVGQGQLEWKLRQDPRVVVLERTNARYLESLPEPVDLVDVFRESRHVAGIVEECIALKLPALWLQDGVVDEAAALRAREAGMTVVMDRCIYRDYLQLIP